MEVGRRPWRFGTCRDYVLLPPSYHASPGLVSSNFLCIIVIALVSALPDPIWVSVATHVMSTFKHGVGIDDWKPLRIDLGKNLLVGGWSWLRESREVSGGFNAGTCLFRAG